MKYIYHYYAMRQTVPGKIAHLDGILIRKTPVTNYDEYGSVKEAIDGVGNLTLCSLTLLTITKDEVSE